jgi:ATP/maltotriose-dependent transcriptional regulator MalT
LVDIGVSVVPLLQRLATRKTKVIYINSLLGMFDEGKVADGIGPQDSVTSRRADTVANLPEPLTERELEVLGLLARRMSYKEIAGRLHITEGTVGQHINHIYRKLDVPRRSDAVERALALGIL